MWQYQIVSLKNTVKEMDRSVKIALAAVVFLVGTSFAFLYRRPLPDQPGDKSGKASQLVLRGARWNSPQPALEIRSTPSGEKSVFPSIEPTTTTIRRDGRTTATSTAASAPLKTTVLSPIDTGQPPPRLARAFPRHDNSDDSRWGAAIGHLLPGSDKQLSPHPRTHKIVDGDTLDGLAKRYLGDPARAGEIFETNRHLLSDPNALPIGVELTIPSGQSSPGKADGPFLDKPLVPVVPVVVPK